jgi:Fur family zinc uptake transcriptional regulator
VGPAAPVKCYNVALVLLYYNTFRMSKMAAKRSVSVFAKTGHDHDHCVATALSAAESVCAEAAERLTPLRRRVLELVWTSHRPIGAYAILDQLKEGGRSAAPPTVYRALEFLLERGLIHRIESLNAFVGCAHPGESHLVQFLICRTCGMTAELDDRRLADAIGRSAVEHGFNIQSRVIELSGTCESCQNARPRGHVHHAAR